MPSDEYQKLRTQVLNNARAEIGAELKNATLSDDGLPLTVTRALQEQRAYLEKHETVVRAAINQRLPTSNSTNPRTSQHAACQNPTIRSVNGKTRGVVFTPMQANNVYEIEGCSFGEAPGIVQLEAHTAAPHAEAIRPITMQLDSASPGAWSDNELRVRLDTELTGVTDHPVNLVIYSAEKRRIELHGCRFVAARGSPQVLSVIPSAWVRLYPAGVGSRSIRQLEYVSPTGDRGAVSENAVPKNVSAPSALVIRSDWATFGIGRDSYDFSHLNPGWVVASVQLQTYRFSCPETIISAQSLGRWEAKWTPHGVAVAFKDSMCTSSIPPSFAFNLSLSQYAIRVWVVGPVGTQPLGLTP